MAINLDPNTQTGQVRYLIGDTNAAAPKLTDEAIGAFLSPALNPVGSIFQAAAMACESLATQSVSPDEKIGDYQISNKDVAANYLDMAERLRKIEEEYPAFASVEENLSGFQELDIIRNWVLRTEA